MNTMGEVMAAVSAEFDVPIEAMTSEARLKAWVEARHVAMMLGLVRTGRSLESIGNELGGRDRATVAHGIEVVQHRLDIDVRLQKSIESIEAVLDNLSAGRGPTPESVARRLAQISAAASARKVQTAAATRIHQAIAAERDEDTRLRSVTDEMKRLRKLGWSISGLAKRYRLLEDRVAAILGEPWIVKAT